MNPWDALAYAIMGTVLLFSFGGALYLLIRLKLDKRYRNDFWRLLEEDRKARENNNKKEK